MIHPIASGMLRIGDAPTREERRQRRNRRDKDEDRKGEYARIQISLNPDEDQVKLDLVA